MVLRLKKILSAAATTCIVVAGSLGSAQATTLYFDTDGATAGFGGSGTWDTSATSNWSTDAAGTSATDVWNQTGGEDIASIAGAITVTVDGTVNVNEITLSGGPTLSGGTINLTGAATLTGITASAYTISSTLAGSNGLTVNAPGNGTFLYSGVATYTGDTGLAGHFATHQIMVNNALPTGTLVSLSPGGNSATRFDLRADQQIAGLASTSTRPDVRGGAGERTLTLDRASGTVTFNGSFIQSGANTINLVKRGGYTQEVTGSAFAAINSQGLTTIEAGVLALSKTGTNVENGTYGALGVGNITITGGTLRLDLDNQIADTSAMSLAGGTFNLNDNDETLGALTLDASSVLAFDGSDSIVTFDSLLVNAGILTITGWDGDELGGGADQLRFIADPAALLASIDFGAGLMAQAIDFGTYFEVVAVVETVPEPASLGLIGLGSLLLLGRGKRMA